MVISIAQTSFGGLPCTLQCPVSFTDFTQKAIQLTVANRLQSGSSISVAERSTGHEYMLNTVYWNARAPLGYVIFCRLHVNIIDDGKGCTVCCFAAHVLLDFECWRTTRLVTRPV